MKLLQISKTFALPLDVAGEAIAILATRGAGKSFTSAVLIEEFYAAQVQTVTIDPTGVYWGLRSDAKGTGEGLPIIVLGGAHGDVPLAETAGKLIADLVVDTGQSLVLDLSDFESDGAQCRFMTDFAERLYRRKARSRTTLHLIVDEADEFAPQQPQAKEARMVGAMAKLVRRGRSRGIGLTLITQRSASLNKNMLDLVETLLLMRMLGPRDRDAANGWIKHKNLADELGVLASLPSLPTGTAWVWSPLRGVLEKVAMRRINTFDSYVTPKPGEVRIEPKALAKVDLDKLGAQIKATAEKAKADDPAALRRRIAELQSSLSDLMNEKTDEVMAIDTEALNKEYQRGKIDGYQAAMKDIADTVAPLCKLLQNLPSIEAELRMIDGWVKRKPAQNIPENIPRGKERRDHYEDRPDKATRTAEPRRRPDAAKSDIGNGAQRRVMIALAQNPEGLSGRKLSILADVKQGGSTWRAVMAALRKDMFIFEYGDNIRLNPDGLRVLGDYEPLPTGEALRAHWRSKMGSGTRLSVFDAILNVYPKAIDSGEVAQLAGVDLGGSTWRAHMAYLRGLELISGRDQLKASEDLF